MSTPLHHKEVFLECAFAQERKSGELACGDTFVSHKCQDGRLIAVLSDGLGSGVKAGVLSTLTATMALRCMERRVPIEQTARTIMRTLPVCKERQISYATFSIVEVSPGGEVRVLEYDSPPFVCTSQEPLSRRTVGGDGRAGALRESRFQASANDRIVVFSDGISQSGMGSRLHPLGWGGSAVDQTVRSLVAAQPTTSAARLSRQLVQTALANDAHQARDDITCGVLYFRKPRSLLIVSGPPFNAARDQELAQRVRDFAGHTIICGGTTAGIVARHLGRSIQVQMPRKAMALPPASRMEGVSLVSEGILTLGAVAAWLDSSPPGQQHLGGAPEPADRILELILDSDIIHFVVGTRINDAHQDPSMPVELEIRRNVVKKIAQILGSRYLKETHVEFI